MTFDNAINITEERHKNSKGKVSYYKHLYDVDEKSPGYDHHREILISRIYNKLMKDEGIEVDRKSIRSYLIKKKADPGSYLKKLHATTDPAYFYTVMTDIAVKHFVALKRPSESKKKKKNAREKRSKNVQWVI